MGKPSQKRPEGNAGRCTKERSKRVYAKKLKLCPNKNRNKKRAANAPENIDQVQVDENIGTVNKPPILNTASMMKLIDIDKTSSSSPNAISGYRLIDMSILAGVYSFSTSEQVKQSDKSGGRKFNEVNLRMVYGCRSIGAGYESLRKMCCHLNMPPPMTRENYDSTSRSIKAAAKFVAELSMSEAAAELRGDADTADVSVSVDGTWQKKGFTSTNGVITAISVDSGKILVTCILSKSCKGCMKMKEVQKLYPEEYNMWRADHKCNQNYDGSSPNMEKVGAETIFGRSVNKYNLFYTSFYGDGDSKAFAAVEGVYGAGKPVTKYKYISHYQKRVGN